MQPKHPLSLRNWTTIRNIIQDVDPICVHAHPRMFHYIHDHSLYSCSFMLFLLFLVTQSQTRELFSKIISKSGARCFKTGSVFAPPSNTLQSQSYVIISTSFSKCVSNASENPMFRKNCLFLTSQD